MAPAKQALLGASFATMTMVVVELCAREVARRSVLELLFAWRPGLGLLVAIAAAAAIVGALVAARAPRMRTVLLFAVLFAAGVAVQIQLGARLQSDGFYYFAYLRSLVFDRDVEFSNDYRMLGLGDKPHLFEPTPTGYAQSAWTIGPAIVWSPFFAAAHPIAAQLAAGGADVNTIGTSYPYRQAVCIAGLFYGLLGCWFAYRFVRLIFASAISAGAVAFTVGGSFMLWYFVKEPSMTHAPAMAGVAGFLWLWASTRDRRTMGGWALLGAIAGFITLIRWQNAIFALLPAMEAAQLLLSASRRGNRDALQRTLAGGALFTLCATLAFLPQMLAWKSIYGSYLAVSPVGPQIRWWDPHLTDILWSSRNGLFSWSPMLYAGAVGLLIVAWRMPAIGIPLIAVVATMTYFNASIQDWWGSDGFGGRRFDGTIPVFALGVAAVARALADVVARYPLATVSAGGVLLILWNLTLMNVAQGGHFRLGAAVSFGEMSAHQSRAFHGWFGNPFTYPASLLFALRNDVPVGAYDLLSANRFLGDPLQPYGRIDIGARDEYLIGGGWHDAERAGDITFRWAATPADVLIPLDHAAPLRLQIRAQAFNFAGAPPQILTVSVNGTRAQDVEVPPDWTTIALELDASYWRSGVNRVELAFSRATRPVDVGLGGDTRPLAAAVDYVRIEVISRDTGYSPPCGGEGSTASRGWPPCGARPSPLAVPVLAFRDTAAILHQP